MDLSHVSVQHCGNLGGGGGCGCVCRAHPRWQHGVGFAAPAAAAISLHKDVSCALYDLSGSCDVDCDGDALGVVGGERSSGPRRQHRVDFVGVGPCRLAE